jgi:hypothetical protein
MPGNALLMQRCKTTLNNERLLLDVTVDRNNFNEHVRRM